MGARRILRTLTSTIAKESLLREVTFLREQYGPEEDWRQRAACRNHEDPDVFFPVGNAGPALDQIEAAKSVCYPCRVRKQCLEWALQTDQDIGVWGGLSEDERKNLRRDVKKGNRQPSLV